MKLKGCPFCGEVDIRIVSTDHCEEANGEWEIYCTSCHVKMTSYYVLKENFIRGGKIEMKDSVISKWNRRYGIQREDTNFIKKDYND